MKKSIKLTQSKGFSLIELLVVIAIIAALSTLALQGIGKAQIASNKLQTVNGAQKISSALGEFERDNGSFPDDQTAEELLDFLEVEDGHSTVGKLTGSANAYFRQLFPGKQASDEKIFYVKGASKGTAKADDIVKPAGAELLKPGENGFAYVMTEDNVALRSTGGKNKVLAYTPVANATDIDKVNGELFENVAVVVYADGTIAELTALGDDKFVKVQLPGNSKLFDKEIWEDEQPVVVLPE